MWAPSTVRVLRGFRLRSIRDHASLPFSIQKSGFSDKVKGVPLPDLLRVASLEDLKARNENSHASSEDLKRKALKFVLNEPQPNSGFEKEGFCFYEGGKVYAFENSCAHNGLELDLDDSDFFTSDGKLIQCKVHGAKFETEVSRG